MGDIITMPQASKAERLERLLDHAEAMYEKLREMGPTRLPDSATKALQMRVLRLELLASCVPTLVRELREAREELE